MKKPKLIVIVGPTATGKSDLAVFLAQKINGEIISADSRQVYSGFDIGSGKITKREMQNVPHHLLDVADPKRTYTAARYVRDATKAIAGILQRGKIPVIVGGTGFYISALLSDTPLPAVPPNTALRKKLEKLSTEKLFALLKKKDPRRARRIDRFNRHRLIRALEIVTVLGKVPERTSGSAYETHIIGVTLPKEKLKKRIHDRLGARIKKGMVQEVQRLHTNGLSWKRLESFGLEYRHIARYLQKKISKEQMLLELEHDIRHYAKRQMTWFKRDKTIRWFSPKERATIARAAKNFLRSRVSWYNNQARRRRIAV